MTDYTKLQSRCQRGEASLAGANNLLAECYGVLGKLIAENERLGLELKDFQWGASVEAEAGDEARTEVSKLRAEIAGLKTGYQAYERVNAELKAEVDSLTREADRQYTTIEAYRKNAERYEWLRGGASVILNKEVGFTAESGRRIYSTMPSQRELDSAIDAAMGKGEQS